jgi:hypothetical protein
LHRYTKAHALLVDCAKRGYAKAAEDLRELRRCAVYDKTDARLKCSGCRSSRDCSPECQREAWPEHKKTCPRTPATAAPAPPPRLVSACCVVND